MLHLAFAIINILEKRQVSAKGGNREAILFVGWRRSPLRPFHLLLACFISVCERISSYPVSSQRRCFVLFVFACRAGKSIPKAQGISFSSIRVLNHLVQRIASLSGGLPSGTLFSSSGFVSYSFNGYPAFSYRFSLLWRLTVYTVTQRSRLLCELCGRYMAQRSPSLGKNLVFAG